MIPRFHQGTTPKLETTVCDDFDNVDWTAEFILKQVAATSSVTYAATPTDSTTDGFEYTLSTVESSALALGVHQYTVMVSHVSDGRVLISSKGELYVLADPASTSDDRTQLQLDLEAIDEAIRAIISGGAVKSYQIQTQDVGARQLERMSLEELTELRISTLKRVQNEKKMMGLPTHGNDKWKQIIPCWGKQSATPRQRYY